MSQRSSQQVEDSHRSVPDEEHRISERIHPDRMVTIQENKNEEDSSEFDFSELDISDDQIESTGTEESNLCSLF